MDVPVRRLDVGELGNCVELAESRDWTPEQRKWRMLFHVGEVYGIDDPAGGLAGMVTLTRFGTEVAGIGMMVVSPRHGRRGLGTRLMTHALREAKTASVWLTATDFGRPLYEKLGFRAVSKSTQYFARFTEQSVTASRPVSTEDFAAVVELDEHVFGAPRTDLLRYLTGIADDFRVVDGPDGPVGYGVAWLGAGTTQIGPVVAADQDMALTLIAELAGGIDGYVRLDIDHWHPDMLAWAEEHRMDEGMTTTVMVAGDPLPGDRKRLFSPVAVAIG
ncbi:GNAT family N-acetyltransferase [Actinocrispum wychmicini]|uniref:Acetyltransferase (GNAT) family protein n=1 Tax=Actinocrispum wychmicini TaxID=1213861 RepID=A0A4R2J252_9PSEU|nr:GNAT family N-acetyltransferase [Actinocrispum wychmicini]TCO50908.1 acetyltransferase (GNAT) family protein [Actinocrispum wychmicini]